MFLAACGAQVEVIKLYEDPSAQAAPYERLLVIGIASDLDRRRSIEDLIYEQLRVDDVDAIRGYSVLGRSPHLDQEAIDAAAESSAADGILISHIVATSTTAQIQEGRVDLKSKCRGGNAIEIFLYDHDMLREPDSVSVASEVAIVTNLYDASSGSRVWTIQTTCLDKASLDDVLHRSTGAIVRELRLSGLVQET